MMSSQSKFSASWTPEKKSYLIELLLEQISNGNYAGGSFKGHAWTEITSKFNQHFRSNYDKSQMHSQLSDMKRNFTIFDTLVHQSGFCWDSEKKIVTATANVWDEYIAHHKDAAKFRNAPLAIVFNNSREVSLSIKAAS